MGEHLRCATIVTGAATVLLLATMMIPTGGATHPQGEWVCEGLACVKLVYPTPTGANSPQTSDLENKITSTHTSRGLDILGLRKAPSSLESDDVKWGLLLVEEPPRVNPTKGGPLEGLGWIDFDLTTPSSVWRICSFERFGLCRIHAKVPDSKCNRPFWAGTTTNPTVFEATVKDTVDCSL